MNFQGRYCLLKRARYLCRAAWSVTWLCWGATMSGIGLRRKTQNNGADPLRPFLLRIVAQCQEKPVDEAFPILAAHRRSHNVAAASWMTLRRGGYQNSTSFLCRCLGNKRLYWSIAQAGTLMRMASNLDIFNFELPSEDMEAMWLLGLIKVFPVHSA